MKKKMSLSVLFFALFLALIAVVSTVDVAAIGPEGTKIGLSHLNQAVHEALGENMGFLYSFTKYLGYLAIMLAVCVLGVCAVQLICRKSLLRVDKALLGLAVLYGTVGVLYVLFEKIIVNYRPMIMPGETAPEASFPSTHTMLFFTILGSAAMVSGRYLKDERKALLVKIACVVLLILGVAFRLGSGVHWLTDICGGVLISSALLLAFSAYLEKIGEK